MFTFLYTAGIMIDLCQKLLKIAHFLDKAWFPSYTWYITHSRNKLIYYCGVGTVVLFVENQLKITYFLIQSINQAINKRKVHKPFTIQWCNLFSPYAQCRFHVDLSFLFIKLSSMKFLSHLFETKTGGMAAIIPSFSFPSKLFRLQHYFVTT